MKSDIAILLTCASLLCASCGQTEDPGDLLQYEADILQWRAERLERLQGPGGYLNLVGLFWLTPGTTTIGSASDNDIVFPMAAADYVGELQVSDQGVMFVVANDVDVRVDYHQTGQSIRVALARL